MSTQKQSACIPPPADYAPRARPSNSGRFRERGAKFGGEGRHQYRGDNRRPHHQSSSQEQTSFTRDQPALETPDSESKNKFTDKFYRNEDDDYFGLVGDNEDDDNEAHNLVQKAEGGRTNDDEDDEDDPLDAYMKSLEDNGRDKQAAKKNPKLESEETECTTAETNPDKSVVVQEQQTQSDMKAVRLDIDSNDDLEESYYQYVEQKKGQSGCDSDEFDERQNLVEYDKDGNIVSVTKIKREIEPLPAVDHSTINYEPFQRAFYEEHDDIKKLTDDQTVLLRSKLEIKVSGTMPPKPVCSFGHFKFDEKLLKIIRRSDYTQPTPIQAQAIPAALLGRNIIGIAMTGSGKTAAYLWPMIVHMKGQQSIKRGDGPIGLVLVPTRELALQVYAEAKKFSNPYKITVVCAYGGGSKYEQSKDLEEGAEVVVATPGRLIDLIKLGATNLRRVTYLVLDEADRFFEMGFEAQVRSICDQIRPDRQTLLFSATFKYKIEQLARTVTEDPVKIIQKSLGEANVDVTQHVELLTDQTKKWHWLTNRLVEFTSAGSVLVFVTRIVNSEELFKNLKELGSDALLLHGDMEQSERNRVITSFKRKEKNILIATDVAARGLDISHIRTVINYDVARDIDTHIHRVGRTGRAGCKGDAYTLLTHKDKEFAGHLVKNLESSNQSVGDDLRKLASQSSVFRKSQSHHKHNGHHKYGRHREGSTSSASSRPAHGSHQDHYHHHSHHHHHNNQRNHSYSGSETRDGDYWATERHNNRGGDYRRDREQSSHSNRDRHPSQVWSHEHHDDRKRHKWN